MRRLLGIGFWVCAAFLLGVSVYGISTSGLKTDHTWRSYPHDRLLYTRPASGVEAELRVRDLERRPTLVVRGRGLNNDEPLRLWLADPTRGRPIPIRRRVDVDAEGRLRIEVRLPERVIQNYRSVIGVQRGRVVFRASLS